MPFAKWVTPKHYTNTFFQIFHLLIIIVIIILLSRVMLSSMRFPPDTCHKLASKKQNHYCGKRRTWSVLGPGAALSEDRSTPAPVVYAVDRCGERHVISATLIYSFAIMWWVTILTDVSLEEAPKGLISSFMCKKFIYRDAIILPNRRSDSKANKIILFVQVLLS